MTTPRVARHFTLLTAATIVAAAALSGAQQPRAPATNPQAPVRDAPARRPPPSPTAGSASISGVVTLSTGQPLGGVRLMVSGTGLPVGRSIATDNAGRFTVSGLPAGRYFVNASKPGYVSVSYGQRRPTGAGTPVQLAEGEAREIAIQLPRGGVITGMVFDERGDPAINVYIRSMRFMTMNGQRRLTQANSVSTDDRGVYRIHSLQPGDYAVCATARDQGMPSDSQRIRGEIENLQRMLNTASGPNVAAMRAQWATRLAQLQAALPEASEPANGYAPVCYPGNAAVPNAVIPVGAGEERAGIDLQLHLTPVASVEGAVVAPQGVELQNVQLTLLNADENMADLDRQGTRVEDSGTFRFTNIAPGRYRIVARTAQSRPPMPMARGIVGAPGAAPPELRLWAAVEFMVAGQDVRDVILELQRGSTFSGQFVFQGTQLQPPADLTRLQVSLTPFMSSFSGVELATQAQGTVDATGRFSIPDVFPGKYRLTAGAPGGPWLATSVTISGQDALDFPIEIKAGQNVSTAVVTMTDRDTELSGALVTQTGQPASGIALILYSVDERFWFPMSRRVRITSPMPDGRFVFRNVPPGDYRLSMQADPDPGQFYDPAFLSQLDATSIRVTLAEGEKKIENLRLR